MIPAVGCVSHDRREGGKDGRTGNIRPQSGSQLVIDQEGNFIGSVSGGCVEGAVVTEAIDAIASGTPKVLAFGVADETAWQVGLACGGKIRIYVEPFGQ
jgi:xanthine/CO dehydrogenase XdhC/CoxF family maturation factor